MLSMYPPARGQFTTPASQDALGLLPCFPEAAAVLPRYFSPYPASYVPRSPLLGTVHKIHEKRQGCSETVELPDAVVFSQYTAPDSSSTSENGGPGKVQEPPKEECTESSAASEEENKAPRTSSSSISLSPSQRLESKQDKEIMGSQRVESKKPAEQPPKSSLSQLSPVLQRPVQRQHYSNSIQHDVPIHRNNLPQISVPTSPEFWSSRLQAPPRFGTATPINSPGPLYQERPPWLAAPVTVRTAVPVCSARPNVVNSTAGAAQARPVVKILKAPSRKEPEAHRNTRQEDSSSAATACSELNKLHI